MNRKRNKRSKRGFLYVVKLETPYGFVYGGYVNELPHNVVSFGVNFAK